VTSLIRYLIVDNPMTFETTRVMRRFLRSNGDTSRNVNLIILGLLAVMYLWVHAAILRYREDMSSILISLELIALTLGVPASMYAAISGERERLTWDSLIMTPLSPSRILVGKLLWRVLLIGIVMALFTSPILLGHSMARYKADMTLGVLFHAQGIIGTWSIFLACFSLWVSTKTKRTATTLSLLSASLLGFLALTPTLFLLFNGTVETSYPWRQTPLNLLGSLLVHFNPFYAVLSVTASASYVHNDFLRDMGFFNALPYFFLLGAAMCLYSTLKVLARMGLPGKMAR
jgi:hypothetical protein